MIIMKIEHRLASKLVKYNRLADSQGEAPVVGGAIKVQMASGAVNIVGLY